MLQSFIFSWPLFAAVIGFLGLTVFFIGLVWFGTRWGWYGLVCLALIFFSQCESHYLANPRFFDQATNKDSETKKTEVAVAPGQYPTQLPSWIREVVVEPVYIQQNCPDAGELQQLRDRIASLERELAGRDTTQTQPDSTATTEFRIPGPINPCSEVYFVNCGNVVIGDTTVSKKNISAQPRGNWVAITRPATQKGFVEPAWQVGLNCNTIARAGRSATLPGVEIHYAQPGKLGAVGFFGVRPATAVTSWWQDRESSVRDSVYINELGATVGLRSKSGPFWIAGSIGVAKPLVQEGPIQWLARTEVGMRLPWLNFQASFEQIQPFKANQEPYFSLWRNDFEALIPFSRPKSRSGNCFEVGFLGQVSQRPGFQTLPGKEATEFEKPTFVSGPLARFSNQSWIFSGSLTPEWYGFLGKQPSRHTTDRRAIAVKLTALRKF